MELVNRNVSCPYCLSPMRMIEIVYDNDEERKEAWTCDKCEKDDYNFVIYIVVFKC